MEVVERNGSPHCAVAVNAGFAAVLVAGITSRIPVWTPTLLLEKDNEQRLTLFTRDWEAERKIILMSKRILSIPFTKMRGLLTPADGHKGNAFACWLLLRVRQKYSLSATD